MLKSLELVLLLTDIEYVNFLFLFIFFDNYKDFSKNKCIQLI